MITSRKEGQERVKQYEELLKKYYNRAGKLSFDTHCFDIVLVGISLASTTGMVNAPDKRVDEVTGKQKTPLIMQIEADVGNLFFVLDDSIISSLTNGFRITCGETIVDMRF